MGVSNTLDKLTAAAESLTATSSQLRGAMSVWDVKPMLDRWERTGAVAQHAIVNAGQETEETMRQIRYAAWAVVAIVGAYLAYEAWSR